MAFGSGGEMLSALEALQEAGIATKTYQNVENWAHIESLLARSGYTQVVSDSGASLGWVRSLSSVVGQTQSTALTTGTTATTTAPVISNASTVIDLAANEVTIADAGIAAAGTSGVGEAFSALAASPKAIVVTASLAALGFTAGFDIGQDLVDKAFFNDETFDWGTDSVGGKIACWLDKDGKAYVDADLLERVKNTLIENGLLDGIQNHAGEWTEPSTVTTSSVKETAYFALNQLKTYISENAPSPTWGSGYIQSIENTLNNVNWVTLGEGIAFIDLYIYWNAFSGGGYVDIKVYHTNEIHNGHLDSDELEYGVNNGQIDFDAGVSWNRYSSYQYSNQYTSGTTTGTETPGYETLSLPTNGWSLPYASYSSLGGIALYNLGIVPQLNIPAQQGATQPTPNSTIANDYPDWWANRKQISTPEEDDIDKIKTVLPLRLPTPDEDTINQSEAQSGEQTDEEVDEQAKTQDEIAQDNNIPNDTTPEDPIGDTPPILPPTSGSDTGLVKIYNPTLATLASFSQWLWSSNIFDNFSKLFQDPMQAIIGLNLLYTTPSRGEDSNIIVGNLNSEVSSRTVNEQYITIDCGTVHINKYFNNVLDYINTDIQLYLPFIGIVPLSQKECVGRDIKVMYNVDVLTGTCLANIYVGSQILYTFNGNCSIQLPLSSANYSSVLASGIGLIGGVGATIASGGALAPLAIGGAANMITNSKSQVERSGNIGSNAGAMGVKKPYLIITRNKKYQPANYNYYYGYPSNTTVKLGNCSGYTRVKDIRMNKVQCTQAERDMIEQQLKGGVIL